MQTSRRCAATDARLLQRPRQYSRDKNFNQYNVSMCLFAFLSFLASIEPARAPVVLVWDVNVILHFVVLLFFSFFFSWFCFREGNAEGQRQ